MSKNIIRVKHGKDNPYMQYRRDTAQDKRLSYEARGLHVYLMSKPDDWIVQIDDLMIDGLAGRDKVKNAIKELAALGYIKRPERIRSTGGKWEWTNHIVYESPLTDYQSMVNQSMVNQSILDTSELDNIETNDLSNKLDKSPDKANRLSDSAILAIALDAKHKPLLIFLAEFSSVACDDLDDQFGEEVRGYLEDYDFIERHDPAMWGGYAM